MPTAPWADHGEERVPCQCVQGRQPGEQLVERGQVGMARAGLPRADRVDDERHGPRLLGGVAVDGERDAEPHRDLGMTPA